MVQQTHPRLNHLSSEHIERLLAEYISGEKVSALLERYKINARPSELIKLLPKMPADGKFCPHCKTGMYIRIKSRSSIYDPVAECDCSHIDSKNCHCLSCEAQLTKHLNELFDKKTTILKTRFNVTNRQAQKTPFELTFTEAIFLLTLINASGEDICFISPIKDFHTQLSPTTELDKLIIDTLINSGLLAINPDSSVDAFEFEGDIPTQYIINEVSWIALIGNDEDEGYEFYSTLLAIAESGNWPANWYTEATELWRLLSVHECLQFSEAYASEYNLVAPAGSKTKLKFQELIAKLPIAKLQNVIYRGVKNSVARMIKNNLTKPHAANCIIGDCERFVLKAESNNWSLGSFTRTSKFQQCYLAYILHNIFLKHGERADEMIWCEVTPEYVGGSPLKTLENHTEVNYVHLTKDNCSRLNIEPDITGLHTSLLQENFHDDEFDDYELAFKIAKDGFKFFQWTLTCHIHNTKFTSHASMDDEFSLDAFPNVTFDLEFSEDILADPLLENHIQMVYYIISNAKNYLKTLC